MSVHLITLTEPLMQFLLGRLRAEGLAVKTAVKRGSLAPLGPMLQTLDRDLLILEGSPDQESADFEALQAATLHHPNLGIILLSANSSSDFLLSAMRAGVREVLPLPPGSAELVAAFRRLAAHHDKLDHEPVRESSRGKIVTFLSCKGGSGATFLATNMAYLIAEDHQQRCALIDLDLQYGDATFYLSDGASKNNISDLTRQIDRLDSQLLSSSMHQISPKLSLLAAPNEPETALSITASQLERVLVMAQSQHDVVVIDLDRSLDALAIKALDMSDVIYLVMQNTMTSVRDAKRLLKLFRSLGYPDDKLQLLLNRHEQPGFIDLTRITEIVGLKVSHTLPNHFSAVTEALNLGKPLAEVSPGSPLLKALRQTSSALLDAPAPRQTGWINRLLSRAA